MPPFKEIQTLSHISATCTKKYLSRNALYIRSPGRLFSFNIKAPNLSYDNKRSCDPSFGTNKFRQRLTESLLGSQQFSSVSDTADKSKSATRKGTENDPPSDNQQDTNEISNIKDTSSLSEEDLRLAIQAANTNVEDTSDQTPSIDLSKIPGTSKGGSRKLAIIYTCNVCNTRSAKKFTERAYNHGVVLVRCPNCESLHLIADRLGYFSDKEENGKGWDIEMFMKSIGKEDNIRVATEGDDVLEVTMDDLLGEKYHSLQSNNNSVADNLGIMEKEK